MIKDCNVLINNEFVTVVNFDGKEIQLPSIHNNTKTVRVLFENGKYEVVSEDYKESVTTESKKNFRKNVKKTTIEEDVIVNEDKDENIENDGE